MVTARRRNLATVKARHSSGKWSKGDLPVFDKNVRTMRQDGTTIVTRTEGAGRGAKESIQIPNDGWGLYQPKNKIGDGITDCSIEWDAEFWKIVDRGVEVLTYQRIKTAKGFLLPPSQMPWVILTPKDEEFAERWDWKSILVSTAHNNLDNTAIRARAWRTEGDNFTQFQIHHRKPGLLRYHCGDINKNFRDRKERAAVQQHFLANTGLKQGWKVGRLPAQGTHGRQFLDQPWSNADMVVRLLADDSSSDHRPLETVLA